MITRAFCITFLLLCVSCHKRPEKQLKNDSNFKAYCLDFNWGDGGPNAFAAPGLWADADPAKHIKWYKELGANIIQTFIVSCNGYAWYKNDLVPEQPGLKHDFLREMVKLGHRENMQVMGYLCIGSNTRWGIENPAYSYGHPADRHLPYTDLYLKYLDQLIRDAVKTTNIDGFMIDWFYQPNRKSHNDKWLQSEKELFEELMDQSFPGEDKLSEEAYNQYSRRAIDRCWEVIYNAAKETDPDCIIWLTSFDITHPHIVDSKMFQQVDWLMNEAGDVEQIDQIRNMVATNTKLITCLANWNKKDPVTQVNNAAKNNVGLYGFVKPKENSLMPDAAYYLSSPISSFEGDDKNIATLVRVYNNYPLNYVYRK